MITDPEVLVLDEPTSAVDSHTEARIADGVRELRTGRTTVVFTSSPLLLDHADRVVLVHEGAVVAVGTHRDLLRSEARYRAVVTRETEEESASLNEQAFLGGELKQDEAPLRGALDDEAALRSALEEIEESA